MLLEVLLPLTTKIAINMTEKGRQRESPLELDGAEGKWNKGWILNKEGVCEQDRAGRRRSHSQG